MNSADLNALIAAVGALDPAADIDDSGTVNFFDVISFLALGDAGSS